jgi:hypothetical protein
LAPNSPLRAKIAALAGKELSSKETSDECPPPLNTGKDGIDQPSSNVDKHKKEPSKASLFPWAMLLARIFEVFPLCCPKCNYPMRIISFIEDAHTIRKILSHINEPTEPPPVSPARGPPEPEFNFDQTYEFA